ncbi:MAG TPA: acyl-CoA thioesterase [Pirellulales bacterium]|nr:acyl-CoA thioesterase [Pirellulales bacterium]
MTPITLTHRLVLPADANHHGTLYAGSLLRIALEAAYATASRFIGPEANILLRRVLSLECYRPVPVGTLIEIRGTVLHFTRAYMVTALVGSPLAGQKNAWMDGLMGFVQVDEAGRAAEFPIEAEISPPDSSWESLRGRMQKLLRIRGRNGVD